MSPERERRFKNAAACAKWRRKVRPMVCADCGAPREPWDRWCLEHKREHARARHRRYDAKRAKRAGRARRAA